MIRFRKPHGPIGLDVGRRHVAAVQLSAAPGRPAIVAAALIDRDCSPTKPISHILSAAEAAQVESVLYRQGFHGRQVATVVPDEALLTSILELPPRSSGAPLDKLVRTELARANKQEAEAIESECWEIPAPFRSAETTHMMAAGCTHAVAGSILDPLEQAGFQVTTLDSRSWALSRAITAAHGSMSGITAVLDIGEGGALLTMLHGETPLYRRHLADGGIDSLRHRIMQSLELDANTATYAVDVLLNTAEVARAEIDKESLSLFDEHMGMLRTELGSAAEYVAHRYPPGLERIFLCGSIGNGAGLIQSLTLESQTSISVCHPGLVAEAAPSLAKTANHPSLLPALGLAMTTLRRAA